MYTKQLKVHYVRSAVFLTALFCSNLAPASSVVIGYDFEDIVGVFENSPATALPGIDALPWSDQHGSLTNFSGNPGRAIAARTFLDSNTLTLIVNVASGFRAMLDGYSFDHLASSTGPATWEFRINAVPIANGDTARSTKRYRPSSTDPRPARRRWPARTGSHPTRVVQQMIGRPPKHPGAPCFGDRGFLRA